MKVQSDFGVRVQQLIVEHSDVKTQLRREGPRLIKKFCADDSLRELARQTGLSPTYLSSVKNKKSVISLVAFALLDGVVK